MTPTAAKIKHQAQVKTSRYTLGSTSVTALWRYLDYTEDQQLNTAAAAAIRPAQLKHSNNRAPLRAFEDVVKHLLAQCTEPLFG